MKRERRRHAKDQRRRNRQSNNGGRAIRVINADANGALVADLIPNSEFGPDRPFKIATFNVGSPVYGDGSNPGSGAICDSCATAF